MDERFNSVKRDHRFRPIRQAQRKIQIDKRFHGIFFNKNFRENFTVDKRGRPVRESSAKNLRRFYHLSKAERKRIHLERVKDRESLRKKLEASENGNKADSFEGSSEERDNSEEAGSNDESDSDSSYLESEDDSDIDLARGKGNMESSSESDDEGEDLDDTNNVDHRWGEMDQEAPRAEDTSHRLALCSMDWDKVKAADIFVLLDSFKPTGGSIRSVTIYPSEYGLKRMAQEERSGPAELKEMRSDDHEEEWTKDDDKQFNVEKLRQYQLSRLKYFYAVIICDSVATAEKIYNDCDGIEFETSSAKIDLRFIPDGMEFNDSQPKEKITSAPDPLIYKPASFITAALNRTTVDLTWDETDHKRTSITKNNFSKEELENMDVKDFLASSSGSEEEEGNEDSGELFETRSKMEEKERADMYRRLLLGECEKEEKKQDEDVDMEITWEPDLKEKVEEGILGIKQKKSKDKESSSEDEKEHEETSKAELEMVMLGDEGKLNAVEGDLKDFEVDVADERFSALYKSSRYAIDRSHSAFKKSDAMEKILEERQERLGKSELDHEEESPEETISIKSSKRNGVEHLVKSVKSKSAWLGKKAKRTK